MSMLLVVLLCAASVAAAAAPTPAAAHKHAEDKAKRPSALQPSLTVVNHTEGGINVRVCAGSKGGSGGFSVQVRRQAAPAASLLCTVAGPPAATEGLLLVYGSDPGMYDAIIPFASDLRI
jgi:hypothetical protein